MEDKIEVLLVLKNGREKNKKIWCESVKYNTNTG